MPLNLTRLLQRYRTELLDHVVPFWLSYGVDRKNGGICTCISDHGEVVSRDKYMWSQLRAIWTCPALYNRIERRKEWLERVDDYAFNHFPVPGYGEWIQNLDRQGNKLETTVALPVKDPFHLARALIQNINLLESFKKEQ